MAYWIAEPGQKARGPFELTDIGSLKIGPTTLAWKSGMNNWVPAAEMTDFRPQTNTSPMKPTNIPPIAVPSSGHMLPVAPPTRHETSVTQHAPATEKSESTAGIIGKSILGIGVLCAAIGGGMKKCQSGARMVAHEAPAVKTLVQGGGDDAVSLINKTETSLLTPTVKPLPNPGPATHLEIPQKSTGMNPGLTAAPRIVSVEVAVLQNRSMNLGTRISRLATSASDPAIIGKVAVLQSRWRRQDEQANRMTQDSGPDYATLKKEQEELAREIEALERVSG